ncbi:MAG: glycosyltransferase [Sphaerochaeta sp.]
MKNVIQNGTKNNRIAIVITGLSRGGAERVTSFLSNFFSDSGREVYLISLTTGEHAYTLSEKVQVIELDASHISNTLSRYLFMIRSLRETIKHIKPNVVLGMMSYSGSLAAVACLGLKIPFLISERNDPNTSTSFTEKEKKAIAFIHRHFVTRAIFQTESARSYYFSKKDARGVIIPNPLYLEEMPPANTVLNRSHSIVTAGRLNNQKNHALLLDAFVLAHKQHPEYILTMYGEGEERSALEEQRKRLGLQGSVFLPGNEKDLFARLQEAELFVLSSNFEGMPNALIEAMAMGLPCITTDYSEGRGTVITDTVNGLVVSCREVQALSNALLWCIEHPVDSEKMGLEAAKIREQLDSRVVCKQWLDTIEETESNYYSY